MAGPGLPGPPVPQLASSSVPLLENRIYPSEGPSAPNPDDTEEEAGPSEQLALTQTSATSSQGAHAGRRSYTPKEYWEPRLREEYEAFETTGGGRRYAIWQGWFEEERHLVYLASGPRSRKLQLRWRGQVKHLMRRAWEQDHRHHGEEQD